MERIKLMSDEELQLEAEKERPITIDLSDITKVDRNMIADYHRQAAGQFAFKLGAEHIRDECERRATEKIEAIAMAFYAFGQQRTRSFEEVFQQFLKEQADGE